MELSEIVAITGMPGLYKVSARRNDGLIVSSLLDDKTQFVSGRNHMFTSLDNVTMYTTDEPASLKDVLASIKKNGAVPDGKDDAKTKAWLEKVLPNYDKEKVYVSDMKKLLKWYGILESRNLVDELIAEKPATEEKAEGKEEATEKVKAAKDEKPKKEAKPKVKKEVSSKGTTKPAPAAKKVTTPRKAQ
ncbi:MAG: DUF5606 domain-containing protein [Chitinophagales bacterium]